MKSSFFIINTSEIVNTKWLSLRTFTCHFTKFELPKFKQEFCYKGFDLIGKFVKSLRSGEYIPKEYYSNVETNYIYLTVSNISKEYLDLTLKVFLDYETGEQYKNIKVDKGDLIITRSGTVGKVAIFEIPPSLEDKVFIPSHHIAVVKTSNPEDNLFWKYYLNFSFFKDFFDALSTGKVQKEITNWAIRKVAVPISINKTLLSEQFSKIDKQSRSLQKENIRLQDSIEEVLIKFGIKTKSLSSYRTNTLNPFISDIAKNKTLRIGARYNDFWLTHNGLLFEGTDKRFEVLPLKRAINLSPKIIIKKGILLDSKILIDFEQVKPLFGKITDLENYVVDIGSDKIDFDKCDFLTNKLRPYLGYTILNNLELPLIGTTEFIPFDVHNKSKILAEYIRYLLLSSEYLEKSKFLMSGKEHPRINDIDILNIKVPLPPKEVQEKIVNEISARELKSLKASEQIYRLRSSIDDLINEELKRNCRATVGCQKNYKKN